MLFFVRWLLAAAGLTIACTDPESGDGGVDSGADDARAIDARMDDALATEGGRPDAQGDAAPSCMLDTDCDPCASPGRTRVSWQVTGCATRVVPPREVCVAGSCDTASCAGTYEYERPTCADFTVPDVTSCTVDTPPRCTTEGTTISFETLPEACTDPSSVGVVNALGSIDGKVVVLRPDERCFYFRLSDTGCLYAVLEPKVGGCGLDGLEPTQVLLTTGLDMFEVTVRADDARRFQRWGYVDGSNMIEMCVGAPGAMGGVPVGVDLLVVAPCDAVSELPP